jgi:hypothetical protein
MSSRLAAFGGATLIALVASTYAKADDRQVIATTFHCDPQYLVMNLPPRPDTWPGAIFTTNLRLPIKHGDPKDPALHRGLAMGINSNAGFDLGASAKGGLSGLFGVSAGAGDSANITLYFPDARIVDMDLSDLINHVKSSNDAIDDVRHGHIPLIVVKSYLGTPVITITKKSNASADAWAQAKVDVSAGVKATAETTDSITYTGKDEIVFAFETSEIHLDPAQLNKGTVNVQLSSLPEALYALRENHENHENRENQEVASHEGQEPPLGKWFTSERDCSTDLHSLCAGVKPGGGRVLACLQSHVGELSVGCSTILSKASWIAQQCAGDIHQFCPTATFGSVGDCMRPHLGEVSGTCKAAMAFIASPASDRY